MDTLHFEVMRGRGGKPAAFLAPSPAMRFPQWKSASDRPLRAKPVFPYHYAYLSLWRQLISVKLHRFDA
jgi:hypothetical protein